MLHTADGDQLVRDLVALDQPFDDLQVVAASLEGAFLSILANPERHLMDVGGKGGNR